jgi:hypothetical protein
MHRGTVEVQVYPYSTSVLKEGWWSRPCPGSLTPEHPHPPTTVPRERDPVPSVPETVLAWTGVNGYGKNKWVRLVNRWKIERKKPLNRPRVDGKITFKLM